MDLQKEIHLRLILVTISLKEGYLFFSIQGGDVH